jgi:hypothetical protein
MKKNPPTRGRRSAFQAAAHGISQRRIYATSQAHKSFRQAHKSFRKSFEDYNSNV